MKIKGEHHKPLVSLAGHPDSPLIVVGPGGICSPRYGMTSNSIITGSKCIE